jgi:hypothetical protein
MTVGTRKELNMPRCCGGATCSCVIDNGLHIQVAGSGTPADPFVIIGDIGLETVDNSVFNLTLNGAGTVASPWALEVEFAPTARLDDLPDVSAPAPTNAQVLGWDSGTSRWTPRAPTTAAAGTVTHDTSLAGDGSAGAPLQANEDPARMLGTTAAGLGLNDAGMNSIVRRFADTTARNAAAPAPVTNALSILGTAPGKIDYWTGTAWNPTGVFLLSLLGDALVEMSGAYTGAERVTFLIQNVETITEADGTFDAIAPADLAGKAGVLTAVAQATAPGGVASLATPFSVVVAPEGGGIKGIAFRLDDGEPMALSPVTCTVIGLVY